MNATERARRSDSLYYDTQVTNRRALCDMIANLESDLEDSKARNAKTLEVGTRWIAKAAHLEAENAKLRELLLDCWDFSHLMHQVMAARFYELGLIDDGEARELGVEVWS